LGFEHAWQAPCPAIPILQGWDISVLHEAGTIRDKSVFGDRCAYLRKVDWGKPLAKGELGNRKTREKAATGEISPIQYRPQMVPRLPLET
jgi:hypothetical protein